MSASIRVDSGISAGTNYWIDRPVLRIGSDPQCDICLPTAELAPHAITLEFRAGNYRVYNRGDQPLTVGSTVVQPGANAVWNDTECLLLPGNVQLGLAIDGDPHPSPRPETRDDEFDTADEVAPAADAAAPEAAKKKSNSLVQLAVIGFCVLGMGAFLTMGRGGSSEAAKVDRPTFGGIVETTLKSEESDPMRVMLPRLQYAQAALVRDNKVLARERFQKLRDQLVRQTEKLPEKGGDNAQKMLEYVEFQLNQMK